jgi:hypothetical protein
MHRIIVLTLTLVALGSAAHASCCVSVDGHFRGNGTYVAPHIRSVPNGTTLDNLGDYHPGYRW